MTAFPSSPLQPPPLNKNKIKIVKENNLSVQKDTTIKVGNLAPLHPSPQKSREKSRGVEKDTTIAAAAVLPDCRVVAVTISDSSLEPFLL